MQHLLANLVVLRKRKHWEINWEIFSQQVFYQQRVVKRKTNFVQTPLFKKNPKIPSGAFNFTLISRDADCSSKLVKIINRSFYLILEKACFL